MQKTHKTYVLHNPLVKYAEQNVDYTDVIVSFIICDVRWERLLLMGEYENNVGKFKIIYIHMKLWTALKVKICFVSTVNRDVALLTSMTCLAMIQL